MAFFLQHLRALRIRNLSKNHIIALLEPPKYQARCHNSPDLANDDIASKTHSI